MSSGIWFIDPFWKIYGPRLEGQGITKDLVMMLKPWYPDVNDLDFVVSLEEMKKGRLLRKAHPASGTEEIRDEPMMGGSRRRKRKSRRKSKSRRRRRRSR